MYSFVKDPDATLDYKVDWTLWLDGDYITTSTWDVPAGLTEEAKVNDTTSATVWLSGGTFGQRYEVINRIITNAGRTDDRTIIIRIRNK
jgi:hypothetical protein